jgi:hypothetical protein
MHATKLMSPTLQRLLLMDGRYLRIHGLHTEQWIVWFTKLELSRPDEVIFISLGIMHSFHEINN